ncbi:MAG: AMP-binding protein [Ilumatobacteraceae bacterium]
MPTSSEGRWLHAAPASSDSASGSATRSLPISPEHSRDDRRLSRHGQPRGHLVVGSARVRPAGGHRPLRPGRTEGAVHRRRVVRTATGGSIARRVAATHGPTVEHVVVVLYLGKEGNWDELPRRDRPARVHECLADHPLHVLYSSGTTGLPKAIVHSHAGIIVEHLKVLTFHFDLGPTDRLLWYTTTGWMM